MTTRHLSTSVTSAMAAEIIRTHILAHVTMTNTTMRLWTGVGTMTVGSLSYDGVGAFGRVETIQEETDVFPRAVRMRLTAVNSAALYEPLTENLFGNPVLLYRAVLDASHTVVNTPELVFRGRMNEVDIRLRDGSEGDYFEVTAESRLRREPRAAYYTRQDIALTHSGDTFFNYLEQIPHAKAKWGQEPTSFADGQFGSGGGGTTLRPGVRGIPRPVRGR